MTLAQAIERLATIQELSAEMRHTLEKGELHAFADVLHRCWLEKRQLTSGVTNANLDRCYQIARENGVLGGTLTGAGGGGLLVLYCPKAHQEAVKGALEGLGLLPAHAWFVLFIYAGASALVLYVSFLGSVVGSKTPTLANYYELGLQPYRGALFTSTWLGAVTAATAAGPARDSTTNAAPGGAPGRSIRADARWVCAAPPSRQTAAA